MRRRRKMLVAIVIAGPAIAVACGFPEVTYNDVATGNEAGTNTDGSLSDAGVSFVDGALEDSAVLPESGSGRPDGAGPVDPTKCGLAEPCDCDDDGYRDIHCAVPSDAGLKDGDCDDTDPLRHPDQDYLEYLWDASSPGKEGDWNCDGTGERKPKVACAKVGLGGVLYGCQGVEAFGADNLKCGYEAQVYKCPDQTGALGSLDCTPILAGKKGTVECR